eukprot:gb/GEZN01013621.1/.p1 GENE.gb/GEZN01013621.1/~~gb/GEZN01013621.1/.p1  ORF type:complete len:211 (+),score=28.55 gb/GEZN01013621.1/:370-1002(+)
MYTSSVGRSASSSRSSSPASTFSPPECDSHSRRITSRKDSEEATPIVSRKSSGCHGKVGKQRSKKKKGFRCETCQQVFATKFSWRRHRKKHTGERPWGCVYCLRYFGEKSTLKKHLQTHPQFVEDTQKAPWFGPVAMNAGTNTVPGPGDESLSSMSLAHLALAQVSASPKNSRSAEDMGETAAAAARHMVEISVNLGAMRHHPYSREKRP